MLEELFSFSSSLCNSDSYNPLKSNAYKWVSTGFGRKLASFCFYHYRDQNLPRLLPMLLAWSLGTLEPMVSVDFCFNFNETFCKSLKKFGISYWLLIRAGCLISVRFCTISLLVNINQAFFPNLLNCKLFSSSPIVGRPCIMCPGLWRWLFF